VAPRGIEGDLTIGKEFFFTSPFSKGGLRGILRGLENLTVSQILPNPPLLKEGRMRRVL
jgi:hypothetical protein